MSSRNRVLSFGGSALVIVLGGVIALIVNGTTGEAISLALVSLGSIAIVSLVFLEVGLSEDRERERERSDARERERRPPLHRRRRPD
ncbi:MAG TPA: hypothetical protein VN740_06215 [Solirubrobacteraceae bacterium]|nr:hypothetical protein [Solirubrobacteraceae bacterium]